MASEPNASAAGTAADAHTAPWRFIPTRVHGMLDYLMSILLILLPLFPGIPRMGDNPWPVVVPIALGATSLVYSLFTNYELGLVRWLPIAVHLGLDVCSGALLAISPWMFRFENHSRWPYVILGLVEIGAALCTKGRLLANARETGTAAV